MHISARQYLAKLGPGLSHLFYPQLCEGCSKPLVAAEQVLCISCAAQLPETNDHNIPDNEAGLRFAGRIPYIHATSYAYFTDEGLLQHLLHGLKYKNKPETGTFLGKEFGQKLKNTSWISDIDLIVPVPLHPKKAAQRGYNQSLLIAEGLSSSTGIPVAANLLARGRNTESQTNKTRNERVANMAGAFYIKEKDTASHKHILLCDDVLTTGATLEACAQALLAENGVRVSIATIGIAI